jgi:UPF0755 protein
VGEIAELLEDHGYIRSALLFKLLVRVQYEQPLIQAGSHTFNEPIPAHRLIEVLTAGVAQDPLHIITFPEGFSVHDIHTFTKDTFPNIDGATLQSSEGYLFPETYFVSSYETIEDLTGRMHDEYEKNIAPLREKITEHGFTEAEVITLASILEREANDETSMRLVSGILQNRLTENLPLQVDATFEYILGKTSAELTLDDLKMESPYNTYTNLGLPPTPIANPGLVAINAVLNPTPSDYFYYLTGSDGNFYYAKDFETHKKNKARYLR